MDAFKSREQKDEFRRRAVQWLEINNKKFDSTNGAFSLVSSMSQSVRTLQGEDTLSSYEPPLEPFDMQEVCGDPIPLVPLILKAHFVNNVTGEGVQSVKKTLYKLASGSLHQDVLNFPAFQMIGHEVPAVYINIELDQFDRAGRLLAANAVLAPPAPVQRRVNQFRSGIRFAVRHSDIPFAAARRRKRGAGSRGANFATPAATPATPLPALFYLFRGGRACKIRTQAQTYRML